MSPANRSRCDSTSHLTVDAYWFGKCLTCIARMHVEYISRGGLPFVVDHVNLAVDGMAHLRLNATLWNSDRFNERPLIVCDSGSDHCDGKCKEYQSA